MAKLMSKLINYVSNQLKPTAASIQEPLSSTFALIKEASFAMT